MIDTTYTHLPSYHCSELPHAYGDHVHLLADPLSLGLLAKLASPHVHNPEMAHLIRHLYTLLGHQVLATHLPSPMTLAPTRMQQEGKPCVWHGQTTQPDGLIVTCAIARAGNLASQALFELMCSAFLPHLVRQDHLFLNRRVNASGEVVGVDHTGSKMGHAPPRYVLLPDLMGATGSTIAHAANFYKENFPIVYKIIALHLVVTPEYLRRMHQEHPDIIVYALRLDRGASADAVLSSALGEHLALEHGLSPLDYILPGAGGLGEVLNHCEV